MNAGAADLQAILAFYVESGVDAVLQDSQGFVWIATEDGLARYDGMTADAYAEFLKGL